MSYREAHSKKIECRDCIYFASRCLNEDGEYYLTPVYEFDTCPYAQKRIEGVSDMDLKSTLFIPDISRIGIQLGNIRNNRGLTLQEVADKAEITLQFIWRVERGKQNVGKIDTILRWCKALGYDQVVFTRGCI